jgi:hypothetical protein
MYGDIADMTSFMSDGHLDALTHIYRVLPLYAFLVK